MILKFPNGEIVRISNWKLLQNRKLFSFITLISTCYFGIIYLKRYKDNQNEKYPSTDSIKATEDSIFFHETSNKGELTIRQACSVESCARMNPESQIHVIFSSPINKNSETLKVLQGFNNIRFFRLHIESYIQNTPMVYFDTSVFLSSKWPMQITSDALRYLTLYKFGGVYLDLDMMVVRPLKFLGKNWAYRESWHIGSAAMALGNDQLGRYIAARAVIDFYYNFDLRSYNNNGPWVITRVLTKLCYRKYSAIHITKTETDCEGFKIYNNITFNPLSYTQAKLYFLSLVYTTLDIESNNQIHGYHMYNYVTNRIPIEKTSFYAKLAKEFCPKIYKTFPHEFSY